MNKLLKHPAFAAILIAMATSCIIGSIGEEMEPAVKSSASAQENPAEENHTGHLTILIRNSAKNTLLTIDSIQLCNTLEGNITLTKPSDGNQQQENREVPFQQGQSTHTDNTAQHNRETASWNILVQHGQEASTGETALQPQRFALWTPDELPQESRNTYLKIYGKIFSLTPSSSLLSISDTPMYTSITGTITEGSSTSTTIELKSNAPIYIEQNGAMIKVLREISFSPSVSGWEDQQNK